MVRSGVGKVWLIISKAADGKGLSTQQEELLFKTSSLSNLLLTMGDIRLPVQFYSTILLEKIAKEVSACVCLYKNMGACVCVGVNAYN